MISIDPNITVFRKQLTKNRTLYMHHNCKFSITVAINLNETNENGYHACLDGLLHQEVLPEKLCLIDARRSIDRLPLHFLNKTRGKFPAATHYKQCKPSLSILELQQIGFEFVSEKYTKRTPLFMWLDAGHFLKPNFLAAVEMAFNAHKYTAAYQFELLPKSGPKMLNHSSFIVTSQTFSEFVNSVQYNGSNLWDLLDAIEIPLPWIKYTKLDNYIEDLL